MLLTNNCTYSCNILLSFCKYGVLYKCGTLLQLKTSSIWCMFQWMFLNVKKNISVVTLMAPKLSMDTTSGDNSTSCSGKVNRRKM